ncbi:hypothetical protein HGM15179_019169 [Zosterops borbonicus]|uniref:RNase H type-1 domain-containing protein n=1 Tax=Zosterops borbonicus TaxID=364589 RepID=A0A8K1D980_9PASS|nr:hypothetical protein HGM15179_019169 [Zosterops borbonicus]
MPENDILVATSVDMIEACSRVGTMEDKNGGLADAMAVALKVLVQHSKSISLKYFRCGKVEELPWLSRQPVESLTVFTDASRKNSKAGLTWQENGKWLSEVLERPGDSLQILELYAVIRVFEKWPNDPINIVSDSLYIIGVVERMEWALLKEVQNRWLWQLFLQVWQLLNSRRRDYFITHRQSHSGLMEGLTLGNEKADQLVAPLWASASPNIDKFAQARMAHEFFH